MFLPLEVVRATTVNTYFIIPHDYSTNGLFLQEKYFNPPPLTRLLDYLFREPDPEAFDSTAATYPGVFATRLNTQADSGVIADHIPILSYVMHDVRAFVEAEQRERRAQPVQTGSPPLEEDVGENATTALRSVFGVRNMSSVELLCKGLGNLHDEIRALTYFFFPALVLTILDP